MKDFDLDQLVERKDGEDYLTDYVLDALMPYFRVTRQVSGTHPTGRRLRLDALVAPRDPEEWKNPEIVLGIEFKSAFLGRSSGERTKVTAQLIDYSMTSWDGIGQIPIFSCPGFRFQNYKLSPNHHPEYIRGHQYAFSRLMKDFNVGELLEHKRYGWSFVLANTHDIWTELTGVSEGRNWMLKAKAGNRGIGARAPKRVVKQP